MTLFLEYQIHHGAILTNKLQWRNITIEHTFVKKKKLRKLKYLQHLTLIYQI